MTPIARFSSAAEAGYFAHELRDGDGIPTRLTLEEQFDAIGGHWAVRYVLAVPTESAEAAAARLSELVQQSAGEEFEDPLPPGLTADAASARLHGLESREEFLDEPEPIASSGVNWVPIVLTLAAGSVAFWAARRVPEAPAAPRQGPAPGGQQIGLWDYIDQHSGVWVQRMENHVGWREMRFDRLHRRVVVREDADGDGVFEKVIPLPADELN